MQVLHEWIVAFMGVDYIQWIQNTMSLLGSQAVKFVTTVTSGNIHEVNERDRVVIASTIEAWRSHGGKLEEDD